MTLLDFKMYKGKKTTVERIYKVGSELFVDLRNPHNGEIYTGIPAKNMEKDSDVKEVVFIKNNRSYKFAKNSDEYELFIKQNKLNPIFIDNCLKGISKTHKGFKIKQI